MKSCLKTGELLPEEGYEIVGDYTNGRTYAPQRARVVRKEPLMHKYELCLVGIFSTFLSRGKCLKKLIRKNNNVYFVYHMF